MVVKDTNRFRIVAVSSIMLVLLPIYFVVDPMKYALFPECPFYALTGLYCPGCGTQRAIHAILHGQVFEALGYNLLACMALPFILYSAAIMLLNTFYKKKITQNLFYKTWFIHTILLFVVLFWILRNLPLPGFQKLAP